MEYVITYYWFSVFHIVFYFSSEYFPVSSRSQWPRGLRRRSAAARLLRLWVRIPPGAWMSVCCECLCCQVEVSATDWSLIQRSPTDCGVCRCVWSRKNLKNEEAVARDGAASAIKKSGFYFPMGKRIIDANSRFYVCTSCYHHIKWPATVRATAGNWLNKETY